MTEAVRTREASAQTASVSVVITCYNHGQFLREAVDSVLAQSYRSFEIIIVDDGSTDNTAQVAAMYTGVRYIYQNNGGLSSARNTGAKHSNGSFLVFLDADDLLTSVALEMGIHHLNAHPDCAFVSGHYSVIRSNGQVVPQSRNSVVLKDHYVELLRRGNYIGMHGTVMYRRANFEDAGGFDPSLRACEDYEMYLRIARTSPVYSYDAVVAQYRRHSGNMSRNRALMLKSSLAVLQAQRTYLRSPEQTEALEEGIRFWQRVYGYRLIIRELRESTRLVLNMMIDVPRSLYRRARNPAVQRYLKRWRVLKNGRPPVHSVRFGDLRRTTPISRHFGFDRGLPIDRYYIERFLSANRNAILGRVLEIGDDAYTRQFGEGRVTKADVFDVSAANSKATFIGDLTNASDVPSDAFDCVIFTQTLQLIYDTKQVVHTLHRILKPGGVLLATFPGISHIIKDTWRQYWCWNFTEVSAQRLFTEVFPTENVSIELAGNVLAATAFLFGVAAEELLQDELDYKDPEYELLIAVKAIKPFQSDAAKL